MENNVKYGIVLAFLLLAAVVIAAKPDFSSVSNPAGNTVVKIPSYAIEVAPGVFSLGSSIHQGKLVEGYAIVDYRKSFGKPSGCNYDNNCQGWEDQSCDDCTGSGGGTTESSCFGFLAKGVKWKAPEPYLINPSNIHGIDTDYVLRNFADDIAKWETAAGADIVGSGTSTTELLAADLSQPDGKNEVYFGSVEDSNAIAVTIVWGVFRGPASGRYLVEWDQVYDELDYPWSANGEPGRMDFENIATHELGHTMGLDDLYTTGCSDQTMYGYADFSETNKRTLEAGDIAGVKELYK